MSNDTVRGDVSNCTDITDFCSVEKTTLGYFPSLPANAFFLGWFAVVAAVQLGLGIRFKTWTYAIGTVFGCVIEAAGYAGRVLMHNNPWGDIGFKLQICCLIIAPAFLSAAIYLTLKHLVIAFGPQYSIIRPAHYTYIFIGVDLISLILQGAGGGIAATADSGSSSQDMGNNLMVAGIIFQVVTLAAFAALVSLYVFRVRKARGRLNPASAGYRHSLSFKLFCLGVFTAYLTILIRCIYRIPEMTGGWRNEIMQNERDFIILDSAMITIASGAQAIFHPGFGFPQMVPSQIARYTEAKSISDSETEMMSRNPV